VREEDKKPSAPAREEQTARGGHQSDLLLDGEQEINLLADPHLSREGKMDLEKEIVGKGLEMMPTLVGHLQDKRVFEQAGPGRSGAITIGQRCERLAHEIILPGENDVVITDLAEWWSLHRDLSMSQIHDQLRPLLERAKKEQHPIRVRPDGRIAEGAT
jgi:hypothetical protein